MNKVIKTARPLGQDCHARLASSSDAPLFAHSDSPHSQFPSLPIAQSGPREPAEAASACPHHSPASHGPGCGSHYTGISSGAQAVPSSSPCIQENDPDSVLKRGVDQLTDSCFLLIKHAFTYSELRSLQGLHDIRRINNLHYTWSLLPRNPRSEGRQLATISTQINAITEEGERLLQGNVDCSQAQESGQDRGWSTSLLLIIVTVHGQGSQRTTIQPACMVLNHPVVTVF